jgi:hypothetical protein
MLMEARLGKNGKREFVQVLRLLETFAQPEVERALDDALRLPAISFDAVKRTPRPAPSDGRSPAPGNIDLKFGNVTVQRYLVTVTSNSVVYSIDQPSVHLSQAGGSGQFTLTASPPDCFPCDPASTATFALTGLASVYLHSGIFYYSVLPMRERRSAARRRLLRNSG